MDKKDNEIKSCRRCDVKPEKECFNLNSFDTDEYLDLVWQYKCYCCGIGTAYHALLYDATEEWNGMNGQLTAKK